MLSKTLFTIGYTPMNKTRKRKTGLHALLIGALGLFAGLVLTGVFGDVVVLAEEASPLPKMRSPVRIEILPNKDLLVSDSKLGQILTVDHDSLEVVKSNHVPGRLLGVAYAKGNIFVGNESRERVEVYNRDGEWQYNLGGDGEVILQPTDIAVDDKRRLVFVVDGGAKAVKVFSLVGDFLYTIPSVFPDPDQLANPTGIALDTVNRQVIVSDFGDAALYPVIPPRLQIYSYDGNLLSTILPGGGWFGGAKFSRPQGLAVNGLGAVFLVDSFSGEVLAFDLATGALLKTLGGYGTASGEMRLPLDVVIEQHSQDVYVTNNQASRIEVFRGGGVTP